jgi:hypothetical protein
MVHNLKTEVCDPNKKANENLMDKKASYTTIENEREIA